MEKTQRMDDLRQFQNPRFARRYASMSEKLERRGVADLRRQLLEGLHGAVIEVGCGDGQNFAHYPATVTHVTAVEPDDTLRTHAERAAARAPVPVSVVAGHADALPVEDGSYDVVTMTLVLCSVPDLASALAEAHRTLRPGGELRFGEHVRDNSRVGGAVQDAITPLTKRFGGGCHQNRDTGRAIEASDFQVTTLRRFPFKVYPLIPGMPMISGVAVRSAG